VNHVGEGCRETNGQHSRRTAGRTFGQISGAAAAVNRIIGPAATPSFLRRNGDTSMYSIHSYDNRREWLKDLAYLEVEDVFFSPDYLKSNEAILDGSVECFIFKDNNTTVIYPYIRRRISGTNFFDITSAYGYGGIVACGSNEGFAKFNKLFCEYCIDNGIVSEFIRFHPVFNNHVFMKSYLDNIFKSTVVVADYTPTTFSLEGSVKKEVLKKTKRAIKKGVSIIEDKEWSYYPDFINLYHKDMLRKHASLFYLFDKEFFYILRKLISDRASIFIAVCDGHIIGGHFVLYGKDYSYNYLSCSEEGYLSSGVNDILQYKVLEWALDKKIKKHVLGGGRNNEDSLFCFKSKFSNYKMFFYFGQRIHLSETYRELCEKKKLRENLNESEFYSRKWFPLYRSLQEGDHS
jgi:hypothetical protein